MQQWQNNGNEVKTGKTWQILMICWLPYSLAPFDVSNTFFLICFNTLALFNETIYFGSIKSKPTNRVHDGDEAHGDVKAEISFFDTESILKSHNRLQCEENIPFLKSEAELPHLLEWWHFWQRSRKDQQKFGPILLFFLANTFVGLNASFRKKWEREVHPHSPTT